MKIIFSILLLLHGLIHLMGFAKAFDLADIAQLTQKISKINGVLWLVSTILFIGAGVLMLFKTNAWWSPLIIAIVISQYLILTSWQDARYGTIANIIFLAVTIGGYGAWNFHGRYEKEVKAGLDQTASLSESILTEADLLSLPKPVQQYIQYTGAVGKPKVNNFKVEFTGQIRKDEQSEWMPFHSEQYNFMDASSRLFYMNATMKHLPVAGFHAFKNGDAFMDIRLFSLFNVQYQSGKEMGIAETVTFFNDMCCMAPATLIDSRIQWLEIDGLKVRASFTNNNITIHAWLQFNEMGELINFISDDRYAVSGNNTMQQLTWSTPLKNYKEVEGYTLGRYAQTIYHYPTGDLTYGTFNLVRVQYNVKEFN